MSAPIKAIATFVRPPILGEIQKSDLQAIRIVEVEDDGSCDVVRNFPICQIGDELIQLYFVSHRGHMRRIQQSVLICLNILIVSETSMSRSGRN